MWTQFSGYTDPDLGKMGPGTTYNKDRFQILETIKLNIYTTETCKKNSALKRINHVLGCCGQRSNRAITTSSALQSAALVEASNSSIQKSSFMGCKAVTLAATRAMQQNKRQPTPIDSPNLQTAAPLACPKSAPSPATSSQ